MKTCPYCGHEVSMHQCWRLTCPANGGSEKLLAIVRDRAMTASAASARRVMRSSLFDPEPPDKALAFVFDDDEEDDDDDG